MRKPQIAIQLDHITKRFQLHHQKPTLVERLMNREVEEFTALSDVNLTLYAGEKVGIIGSNGSGKTTLLKIVAGISHPTKGAVKVKGRVVSLIDLEAGFHPDLSGVENIFLNGLVIGMSKTEVRQKLKKIIAFADIGKFIDAPLHTYSDGMKLRLGFSVAVHSNPDVLILDEGFAAGDDAFQRKARKKINFFFKQKKTILIVSHWLEYLQKICPRIIWFSHGKIMQDGPQKKVIAEYLRFSRRGRQKAE